MNWLSLLPVSKRGTASATAPAVTGRDEDDAEREEQGNRFYGYVFGVAGYRIHNPAWEAGV